ncbi:MAG: hypothetical protein DI618_04960 [Dermacoccus nishinomiyaensis]|nr:MAG: hypothetical protein DI618_04960 [Dermacoccus nishinomiyaensis]
MSRSASFDWPYARHEEYFFSHSRSAKLIDAQEQGRQDERAEEVAAPLQFVAVLRQHALRGRHDAGVVDEDVEPLAVAADLVGEGVGRNVEAALRRVVKPHPLGWVCPRPPGMREARRARAPCS